MKAADAKAPKFESKWWALNKAKAADADGKFAKALEDYEKARADFDKLAKTGKVATGNIDAVSDALKVVATQAKAKKADSKLGVLQKDTKDALANYEKASLVAIKDLATVLALPALTMNAEELIKKVPQFEKYCKIEFSQENVIFAKIIINKETKSRAVYDTFISQKAKTQVNLPDKTRIKFDKAAEAIAANPDRLPDTPATWDKAPWDEALSDILKLLNADTKLRFRTWVVGQATKSTKLP